MKKVSLKNQPEITAIFTINNNVATACLQVLNTLNVKIPDKVSLISFDDITLFKLTNPSITSIAQPINEICEKTVEILLNLINNKDDKNTITEYTLSPKLNIRNSCVSISQN